MKETTTDSKKINVNLVPSENEDIVVKRQVGRPKLPDSEKAVYQRMPIKYETYKKIKKLSNEQGKTYSEFIESMLTQLKLNY